MNKACLVMLGSLALAGCGSRKTDEAATAGGKVLPGSISDAMIDLDASRSEAPLAAPGSGAPVAVNTAAAELLGGDRGAASDAAGAGPDEPAPSPDDSAPGPAASDAAVPTKAPEPAKPAPAATGKPPASAPARPKVRPAFRKPTDEPGA